MSSIKKRITALSEQLNEHSYRYHVLNDPVVSDEDYDRLYQELVELEEAHPKLRRTDSPTSRVGEGACRWFCRSQTRRADVVLGQRLQRGGAGRL